MSNRLAMDKAQSIQHLHDLGWSQRKIAATLSVDRKSVKRYLEGEKSKGTAPTGQAPTARELAVVDSKGTSAPTAPVASITEPEKLTDPESVAGVASSSARSGCAAYHESIVAGLKQQLTAQRIYQDLVTDHGFSGSYWSVNRYVKSCRASIRNTARDN